MAAGWWERSEMSEVVGHYSSRLLCSAKGSRGCCVLKPGCSKPCFEVIGSVRCTVCGFGFFLGSAGIRRVQRDGKRRSFGMPWVACIQPGFPFLPRPKQLGNMVLMTRPPHQPGGPWYAMECCESAGPRVGSHTRNNLTHMDYGSGDPTPNSTRIPEKDRESDREF